MPSELRLNTARLSLRPVTPADRADLVALGFDRVRAQTMAVNYGSRRLLEKAGFRYVATAFPRFLDSVPEGDKGEVIYEVWRGVNVVARLGKTGP